MCKKKSSLNGRTVCTVWDNRTNVEEAFEYLGNVITNVVCVNEDIDSKVRKSSNIYYTMNSCDLENSKFNPRSKILIWKTIMELSLLFSGGTQTLKWNQGD